MLLGYIRHQRKEPFKMNARLENIKSCNILLAHPPPLRPPDAFAEPLVSLPSTAQDTLLVLRSVANQNITPLVN